MKARSNWNAPAAVLGVAGLLGIVALVPGAQAAGPVHHCANRSENLEINPGAGQPVEHFKTTIKAISTQGVSCSAADRFLDLLEHNKTSIVPEHYKCSIGHFKAPTGYVPQVCMHKGAVIKFAGQGG
jgi:hypothetical protein